MEANLLGATGKLGWEAALRDRVSGWISFLLKLESG